MGDFLFIDKSLSSLRWKKRKLGACLVCISVYLSVCCLFYFIVSLSLSLFLPEYDWIKIMKVFRENLSSNIEIAQESQAKVVISSLHPLIKNSSRIFRGLPMLSCFEPSAMNNRKSVTWIVTVSAYSQNWQKITTWNVIVKLVYNSFFKDWIQ